MQELGQISFSNRQLYYLILPLIVEQFLGIAVGLADSIMVASVGEAAVSSVSLVDSINVLLFYAFSALATGGAVVCGQFIGHGDLKKANNSAQQLLVFITFLGLMIAACLYLSKTLILRGLFGSIDQDVMDYCNTYFLIVEASIPFMAIYTAGAALFRVMGNSSISMKVSMTMNIINVSGNAILIFGFHRGVEGVAIPTLISRLVGAVIIVALLRNQKYMLHINKPFSYKFDKYTIRNILRIGIPSGLESSLFHLGKIILLSVVTIFGTASIAANAIGNSISSFQILPGSAIGVGMITVVSQCVGAKEFDKARFYTRKLMKWTYVSMLIMNILIFLIMPVIISLYNVSDESATLARLILWMHGGMSIFFWPLSFSLPQSLKAAGDTTYVMGVAVGSMWIFRIVAGIFFAKYLALGVVGIWLAMFVDWMFRIILFIRRYRGHKWETKHVC